MVFGFGKKKEERREILKRYVAKYKVDAMKAKGWRIVKDNDYKDLKVADAVRANAKNSGDLILMEKEK